MLHTLTGSGHCTTHAMYCRPTETDTVIRHGLQVISTTADLVSPEDVINVPVEMGTRRMWVRVTAVEQDDNGELTFHFDLNGIRDHIFYWGDELVQELVTDKFYRPDTY